MVNRTGADVGRLLDVLVELGLKPETLVMFGADNRSAFEPDSTEARRFNGLWTAALGVQADARRGRPAEPDDRVVVGHCTRELRAG